MRRRLGLVAACVPAVLACGGLGASVDVDAHLQPICMAAPAVMLPGDLDLPQRDAPPVALGAGTSVVVRPAEVLLDGFGVNDLADEAREALARDADVASRSGAAPQPPLLFIEARTPASQVADTLAALVAAGASSVLVITESTEPWGLPDYPAPGKAEALKAELANYDGSMKQAFAAAHLDRAIKLCPPATKVFHAVATASHEQRCTLMARGLDDALPLCVLTDVDAVVSIVQVLVEPTTAHKLTATPVVLDPEALPLEPEADTPWSELVGQLRTPLWVAVAEG